MELSALLAVDRVMCDVRVADKNSALELIAGLLTQDETPAGTAETLESLHARERLGSTGLGHGFAIPHGRRKDGQRINGAFVRLAEPIAYDAIDRKPVDLLFALLVPEASTDEHLLILAKLASLFTDSGRVDEIRAASSAAEIHSILIR